MRLVLYQPDIPQNVGAAIRLSACLGVGVDVIEPCGFPFSAREVKRSAMDYADIADLNAHASWDAFEASAARAEGRLLLLTTKAEAAFYDFDYQPGDLLMMGRESAGAPDEVHAAADARLTIPMDGAARSMNVVTAAALVLGEALRQTRWSAPAKPDPT